jgi:selenocysteine lyase/cysteine desulfurase
MNQEQIRGQFPALKNWTYLNTATYGQIPLRSQQAVAAHFARRDELACSDFLSWFDDMDEVRGLAARLIHCQAEDIAFCSNACAALSLFLGGIAWNPGDRVLTLPDEFPNQYYYANTLRSRGVELLETNSFDSLPDRTRAIVLSTVNYTNGYRADVAHISRLGHDAGALLYIDGTQSVGALQFDTGAVQPDMLAIDPYKWLLSPNGASFFYISPELRRTLQPVVIGWRSDQGWRSVDELHHGVPQFPLGAERYEGGMLNFPSLYGMAESIRMNLEIGADVIERRVLELSAATASALESCGAEIVHRNSNIVAAHWPDRDASALAKQLREQRIIVAARHGNLRVSPQFYNDESDIEKLRSALANSLRESNRPDRLPERPSVRSVPAP